MANLTLTIDTDVLRRARIRALERDTSVNALVRDYLVRLAGDAAGNDPIREFLALSERSAAGSGPEGRRWTRDGLHER
jgi:hypothetical protein